MPVHKIPAYSLHEDLLALEREGESVQTVTPIYDGVFFVVTTRFHGTIETRLGRHTAAARLGADSLYNAMVSDDIIRPDGAA